MEDFYVEDVLDQAKAEKEANLLLELLGNSTFDSETYINNMDEGFKEALKHQTKDTVYMVTLHDFDSWEVLGIYTTLSKSFKVVKSLLKSNKSLSDNVLKYISDNDLDMSKINSYFIEINSPVFSYNMNLKPTYNYTQAYTHRFDVRDKSSCTNGYAVLITPYKLNKIMEGFKKNTIVLQNTKANLKKITSTIKEDYDQI